jgi:hypothetical protein
MLLNVWRLMKVFVWTTGDQPLIVLKSVHIHWSTEIASEGNVKRLVIRSKPIVTLFLECAFLDVTALREH